MNNTTFSLADLIALLTALLFGFVCYLGANFYTLGHVADSFLLSIIITILLFGTALGAKLLKRTSRNFKSCFIWEVVMLVLFTIFLVYFSFTAFPHYFTVSGQRAVIQSKLNASISQTANMFADYELYAESREKLFKSRLQSVAKGKLGCDSCYTACGFKHNGVLDSVQINNKIRTLHLVLFPNNYRQMKEADSLWLANTKNTLNNSWAWNLGVVDIVNNIEQNSNNSLRTLINHTTKLEKCESNQTVEFSINSKNPNITSQVDVKSHFTTLDSPKRLSIGLSIVTYIIMLISWLITKRHTRFPGLKILFGSGGLKSNSGRTIITE